MLESHVIKLLLDGLFAELSAAANSRGLALEDCAVTLRDNQIPV